jgi:hypothetical protein
LEVQFPGHPQAADFKGTEGSIPWRDFANGEMRDNGSAQTCTKRGDAARDFQPNKP